MPEMPAFLANVLEPRFARVAHVMAVDEPAPGIGHVVFAGPALRGLPFRPGHEVEFRVSDRAFRHYTPSLFDAKVGRLEVVFHVHGRGPGSSWASRLAEGNRVGVLGPGGSFAVKPAARHVLLGDETTLGLFACLARTSIGRCSGAVEVDPGLEGANRALGLRLAAVPRVAARGEALLDWLARAELDPRDDITFALAGHAATIVRLRARLLDMGFARGRIRTKAYWADGKRGL